MKGLPGAYRVFAIDEVSTRSISVNEFEEMSRAADEKRAPREKKLVEEKAWEDLERRFWSGCISNAPLYGADSPGTLFDTECEEWNVANLPSLLHAMPGEGVPGVSLPFLYFGQWKSMFSWHIEDVNLYSINYLHFGSPKQWYGIAPRDAARFERALGTIWPIEKGNCTEFIRHKEHLVSPTLLKERYGISVMRTRQMPGEFMVLWPQCYHQGFNYGFNCAERSGQTDDIRMMGGPPHSDGVSLLTRFLLIVFGLSFFSFSFFSLHSVLTLLRVGGLVMPSPVVIVACVVPIRCGFNRNRSLKIGESYNTYIERRRRRRTRMEQRNAH